MDDLDKMLDGLIPDDTEDRRRFEEDLRQARQDSEEDHQIQDYVDQLLSRKLQEPPKTPEETIQRQFFVDPPKDEDRVHVAQSKEEFFSGTAVDARMVKFSRLRKEFTKDEIKMFYALALSIDYRDNNQKSDLLTEYLKPKGFICLGTGTNRVAYKKGRYVFKFALDRRGIADMLIEAKRSEEAEEYVAHCFECCGVVAVEEYIDIMDEETFGKGAVKEGILAVLKELSKEYILGDMGYDAKNYCNIGFRVRKTDEGIAHVPVFLDFAYMHPKLGNEEAFTCVKCGTPLEYNDTYTRYVCPKCGATFDYRDILWRINMNAKNFENSFLSDVQSNLELELDDLDNLSMDADI